MNAYLSPIIEVEDAIDKGTVRQRSELLQRVTDLFIIGAVKYTEREVALFDDVITRLAVDIELSVRILLAIRLAPIRNAPPNVIRALAFDDVIDVAGPVLIQSERLDDATLVQNALAKSQEHLLAISQRKSLSEAVTDVLLERGDQQIILSTAANTGAKFSSAGFEKLVERSTDDDRLAECVGFRPEIPPHLFLKLLAIASETARTKLEAVYPHAKREVQKAVNEVSTRIQKENIAVPRDYGAAKTLVHTLHQLGQLDDNCIAQFAKAGRFEETTIALSLMCDLPLHLVEQSMIQGRSETVLIIARVIGLSWSTLKAILLLRDGRRVISADDLAQALAQFERLKPATANEIVRFYRMRSTKSHEH